MKKEQEAHDKALQAMHEFFWNRKPTDPLVETMRKQKELVEAWHQAEKAYKAAYAEAMRKKFLDLGDTNEAV